MSRSSATRRELEYVYFIIKTSYKNPRLLNSWYMSGHSVLLNSILPDTWQKLLTSFLESNDFGHDFDAILDLAQQPGAVQESMRGQLKWDIFKCSLRIGDFQVPDGFEGNVPHGTRAMTLQLENRWRHPFFPSEKDEDGGGMVKCREFSKMLQGVEDDFHRIVFPVIVPALAASDYLYLSHTYNSSFFKDEFRNGTLNEWSHAYMIFTSKDIVLCFRTVQGEFDKPLGIYRNRLQTMIVPKGQEGLAFVWAMIERDNHRKHNGVSNNRVVWSVFDTGMDRALALAMGTHARLGMKSCLNCIDPALLYMMRKCFISDISQVKFLRDQVNGSLFSDLKKQLGGGKEMNIL
jgi:hypothetical protein